MFIQAFWSCRMSNTKFVFASALALAATCVAGSAWRRPCSPCRSWLPPTHMLSETQKEWCAMLEKKTAGKVKCNILPRAVAAPPGTFDAVRNGLADLSFTVQGYTPGRFVTTQMAEVPFLGNSSEPVSVAFQRMLRQVPGHRRRAPGREGARGVHPRPGHRLQHQAADHQGRRPVGPEVPRRRRHGQRDHARRWA